METRLLTIFVEAAKAKNFRAASQKLGIAQPAVTQRIRQFEAMLGFPLFHRINRGVELTPGGQAMLVEAEEVLARTSIALEKAKQIRRGEVGEIRIGFGTSVMAEPKLPELVGRYIRTYPDISVELLPGTTMTTLVEDVANQEIDVSFMRAPVMPLPPNLRRAAFDRSALSVALAHDHPLRSRAKLCMTDIADEKLLLPVDATGVGLSHSALSLYEEAGIQPDIVMRVANITAILGLVSVGIGIAILPANITTSYSQVVGVPLSNPDAFSESVIVYRRGSLATHVQNFIQMARMT